MILSYLSFCHQGRTRHKDSPPASARQYRPIHSGADFPVTRRFNSLSFPAFTVLYPNPESLIVAPPPSII